MEAKRTLEENQRKRFVSYACRDDISNSKLLIAEVIFCLLQHDGKSYSRSRRGEKSKRENTTAYSR